MMNPESNQFEAAPEPERGLESGSVKQNSKDWCTYKVGEHIEVKGYIFVVNKIDTLSKPHRLVLVPVGPAKASQQLETLNRLMEKVQNA